MELPIYKLIINDEDEVEVNCISVVDEPATQNYAAYMSEQKVEHQFQVFNEEKRYAIGALMVANKPIYRRDEKTGKEFFVVLDAENIEKAMVKFFERGYQNNVNLMHDPKQPVEGMTLFQHFIVNHDLGIRTPKGFEKLPEGSSFGIFKVKNDAVWEKIKANKFGFSIEGVFKQEPMVVVTQEEVERIMKALEK